MNRMFGGRDTSLEDRFSTSYILFILSISLSQFFTTGNRIAVAWLFERNMVTSAWR